MMLQQLGLKVKRFLIAYIFQRYLGLLKRQLGNI